MKVRIEADRRAASAAAAAHGADIIRRAISGQGKARVIAATGASRSTSLVPSPPPRTSTGHGSSSSISTNTRASRRTTRRASGAIFVRS